jgi:hypothetical protein
MVCGVCAPCVALHAIDQVRRIHNAKLWQRYTERKAEIIGKHRNRVSQMPFSQLARRQPVLTPLLDSSANECVQLY